MEEAASENRYKPYSNFKMLGYSLGGLLLSSMWILRGLFQLYGNKAFGIPTAIIFIIVLLYIIWDAANDPITGYLLDRSKRLTSKRGKRFPFMIIGGLGGILFIILLYSPVTTDPMISVFWILFMLLAWDQFQTLFELSSSGFTVDIFRDKKQRVKLGAFGSVVGAIGNIVFGITPPIILGIFGGESSAIAYFFMVLILGSVLILIFIPFAFSIREPSEMIELRTRLDEEGKGSSPFKEIMKRVLTDKNWMSLVFVYLGYVICIQCVSVGSTYYVIDGLGLPIAMASLFNLAFVLVGVITIPIWRIIAHKYGGRKTYLFSLSIFVIAGCLYPILAWSLVPALILSGIIGIANTGAAITFITVNAETIDNACVKSGKREETSYQGVLRFFSASGILFQVLIFMLVEIAFGYDPTIIYDYEAGIIPSDLARIGLNLRVSLIPGLIVLITMLIYIKFNKVTAKVAFENKRKLIEMGL